MNGLLHQEPKYWLTALPALVIVGLIIATFPSTERIVSLFEEYRGTWR